MVIYLQSFFSEPMGYPFSVSRFQPKGYKYLILDFLQPYTLKRTPIKNVSPEEYKRLYCNVLALKSGTIREWLKERVISGKDITLCCWCNEERQRNYERLFCHTILIGYFIESLAEIDSLDIKVEFLDGRDKPVWSREEYRDMMREIFKGRKDKNES